MGFGGAKPVRLFAKLKAAASRAGAKIFDGQQAGIETDFKLQRIGPRSFVLQIRRSAIVGSTGTP